jgi:flavodoxin
MKGIVAYDSVHGNTKQVAEAIAEEIRAAGHEVELIFLKESESNVAQGDFLFIGSPIGPAA